MYRILTFKLEDIDDEIKFKKMLKNLNIDEKD